MSASDSAPRSRPAGLGGVAALLVLSALIALGFLVFWNYHQKGPQPPAKPAARAETKSDIAILRDRLAADETRIAQLERQLKAKTAAAPTPSGAAPAQPGVDERRLADLDLRLATLEHNAPGSDWQRTVANLNETRGILLGRVVKLETADPSARMRLAAAELAYVNLVRAGANGPFAAELKAFQALMPDAKEADGLAAIAPRGASSEAVLVQCFPDMAAKALAAERAADAKGWTARLWASLSNLVVIRRVGDQPGMTSEAILARAGTRLNQADLAGAVSELHSLRGAASIAAQTWLVDAQARLTVDRVTAALAARMAKALAQP